MAVIPYPQGVRSNRQILSHGPETAWFAGDRERPRYASAARVLESGAVMTQEVRVREEPDANPPDGVRTKAQKAIGVKVLVMGSFNVCRCREPGGW